MSERTEANRVILPADPNPQSADAQLRAYQDAQAPKFSMIVFEDGDFRTQQFNTLDEFTAAIKKLLGTDAHVFPFIGYRMPISKPPLQYLVRPAGDPIPLFDLPSTLTLIDDGYLGREIEIAHLPVNNSPGGAGGPRRRRPIELGPATVQGPVDTGETSIFPADAPAEEQANDEE